MGYRVTVQPGGHTFVVQDDETVLEAALRCGYFFPHHCRMGTCGTCKGKIMEGKIDYGNAQLLAITQEEQDHGDALFCCAHPKTDLTIQVEDVAKIEISPLQVLTYQVMHHESLQNNITRIQLKSPDELFIDYQAGQYVKIIHSSKLISPMSVACAPVDSSLIELHLHHPADNAQALDLLHLVNTTKMLTLRGPYGSSTFNRLSVHRPLIFIANGTGLAPIKAIMEMFLQTGQSPPIYLYWYAEDESLSYAQNIIKDWQHKLLNFHFKHVTEPSVTEIVLQAHSDISRYQVYVVDAEDKVYDALFTFMRFGLLRGWFFSDVLDYKNE